jgi:hypothetical protein
MVRLVREQNIYRWASMLLDDLSRLSAPVGEAKNATALAV